MGLPYADPTNTGEWAHDLLSVLGDPETATNVGYIEAWEQRESPSGFGYNPLGDETPGVDSIHAAGNSASVQAYTSWLSGLDITAYNLTSLPQNSQLVTDLKSGDASLAELSQAQAAGGWSGGLEKDITSLGSSTPFIYGGAFGEQSGAKGVATSPGDNLIPGIGPLGLPAPAPSGNAAKILAQYNAGKAVAGDYDPAQPLLSAIGGTPGKILSFIEAGAADITFIGFGILLVVVGIAITFKSEGEEAAPVAAAAVA